MDQRELNQIMDSHEAWLKDPPCDGCLATRVNGVIVHEIGCTNGWIDLNTGKGYLVACFECGEWFSPEERPHKGMMCPGCIAGQEDSPEEEETFPLPSRGTCIHCGIVFPLEKLVGGEMICETCQDIGAEENQEDEEVSPQGKCIGCGKTSSLVPTIPGHGGLCVDCLGLMETPNREIRVIVEGGLVQEVLGLPEGCTLVVEDHDLKSEEEIVETSYPGGEKPSEGNPHEVECINCRGTFLLEELTGGAPVCDACLQTRGGKTVGASSKVGEIKETLEEGGYNELRVDRVTALVDALIKELNL